jgi:hypothetical protein
LPESELLKLIQGLPDHPHLIATGKFLEMLKETYDDLDRLEAERMYREQDIEARQLLMEMKERSTHSKAKRMLIGLLEEHEPFSLFLRTFESEAISGKSVLTGSMHRTWMSDRPLERQINEITPLPLIGIANPIDPFPSSDVLQIEIGENWLTVVMSLVERAAAIFVICDRFSGGLTKELLAIQMLEREDDTFIILPSSEMREYYTTVHFWDAGRDLPTLHPERLRRQLVTFGMTGSSEELANIIRKGA